MASWLDDKKISRAQGDTIFREGDEGEHMFVIISGKVLIYRELDGNRIELAQMEKGDFFGEMGLLERLPRTASAEVAEDAELLVISPADFDDMLRKNTEIAIRIMRKYSQRLRNMHKLLEEHYQMKMDDPGVPSDKPKPRGFESSVGSLKSIERGRIYPIMQEQMLIGRRDAVTGVVPDIDLFDEDIMHSVSRQHAWLDVREDGVYLTEEVGVTNGTWVNDTRLSAGESALLTSGDTLRFGYVLMVYHSTQLWR